VLRYLLTALPVLTVAVVSLLVLVLGAERPVPSVRVWGGPTDGLSRFSAWIQVEDPATGIGAGDVVQIEARAMGGASAASEVRLDGDGRGQVELDFARPPGQLELNFTGGGRVLGSGSVGLTREAWQPRVRRLGGPVVSRAGALGVMIAPLRGTFAVPFAGELVGRVEWQERGSPGAVVSSSSDGATVTPERAVTDARGNFVVTLRPTEHIVTLRVTVQTKEGQRGELFTSLPVLPGAILAERRGSELVVTSPIERASVDVSLVSEAGRWFGARVQLTQQGDGRALGSLTMPALPETRLWAVVSGDSALASTAAVGWPLFAEAPNAERTFDAVDRLLLDTRPALESAERARRRGVRRLALLLALLGACVSVASLLLASARARSSSLAELGRELGDGPSRALVPSGPLRALLTAGLLTLGFLLVTAIVAWRLL
jgi:hypothetical protein